MEEEKDRLPYLSIRYDPEADTPVEHRAHPIDETFIRAADQLARKFEPQMHVDYMGTNYVGGYASNEDGFIARLALLDLELFDAFVAGCHGIVTSGVVKSLKDVRLIQEVPMPRTTGHTRVSANTTLMPSKIEHFMHMSAQFSKGIDISQTNRSFIITLHAKGYVPRTISLTGAQIPRSVSSTMQTEREAVRSSAQNSARNPPRPHQGELNADGRTQAVDYRPTGAWKLRDRVLYSASRDQEESVNAPFVRRCT